MCVFVRACVDACKDGLAREQTDRDIVLVVMANKVLYIRGGTNERVITYSHSSKQPRPTCASMLKAHKQTNKQTSKQTNKHCSTNTNFANRRKQI